MWGDWRVLVLALLAAFGAGVLVTLVAVALSDGDSQPSAATATTSGAESPSSIADTVQQLTSQAPSTIAAPATTPPAPTPAGVGPDAANQHIMWETFEIDLMASADHAWSSFPVQVVFRHTDTATEVTVDGFWDGGRTWQVRFVPMLAGEWIWSSQSDDQGLAGATGSLDATEPPAGSTLLNANYAGHLRISDNDRHLERADGSPFFFLGDTGWWLNSTRCPLVAGPATEGFSCSDYFDDRVAKGFSVIGIEMFDIHNANEAGLPFPCNTGDGRGNGDYSCLSAEHFQQLDVRMQQLWERGLVAYANVSWLVGQLPNEKTTLADAQALGQYIMARYGWMPMVFSLSGEYQYGYDNKGVLWTSDNWNSYGAHMQRHNPQGHPLTIHPSSAGHWEVDNPGAGGQSSAGEFHRSEWLDLNSIQSGHQVNKLELNPLRISEAVELSPTKPVLHAEGYYLENTLNREPVTDPQLRWQAYVPVLNGALGHIYGANGIWQMFNGGDESDYPELRDPNTRVWWEVMRHPSSTDVGRSRTFYEVLVGRWWELSPQRSWLGTRKRDYRNDRTDAHLAATPDRATIVVFFGELEQPRARVEATDPSLASRTWTARWFDPRTGDVIEAGRIAADDGGVLRFPDRPFAGDWALVLKATG
ncbi:MAG: DUF4038 domain-containing protein [Actinomycetota bacterium]|nr:DUF4038 domain-containing protein [Actinomycetota bacterium]